MTGLHADAYVPGFNTLRLAMGNRHNQGCDAEHTTWSRRVNSKIFRNDFSAVMRQTKAEGSTRLRAIVRSRTTTD